MKLIVLIPAFNEAENIEKVILSIPRKITKIDQVEVLVVNDGSVDNTSELALNGGADKIITHKYNRGVGAAFMTGIRNAITMGADIVVTIDADSQFDSNQIPEMIIPIVNNQSDIVIGSRFFSSRPENMPKIKYFGNKIFSRIVSKVIGQKLTDTQTGFRAYSREALFNISIVNDFTYTQEVLIDLKFKGMRIVEIPVSVKFDDKRKSRVVKNVFQYSFRAISIIVKTLIFHRPILTFWILGFVLCVGGTVAKLITVFTTFGWGISADFSTGLIILGIVSFLMGIFANIVFKRQAFAERDLRHYVDDYLAKK